MLFLKECISTAKSFIYFAFLAVILVFYVTQMGNYAGNDIAQYKTLEEKPFEDLSDNPLVKPVPGQEEYGYVYKEIPERVMPNAIVRLSQDIASNEFNAYPTGFHKTVKLNSEQLAKLQDLLTEMTGLTQQKIFNIFVKKASAQNSILNVSSRPIDYSDVIPVLVDYTFFKAKMAELSDLIGHGSDYSAENLKRFCSVPKTYEEKMAEQQQVIKEDRITGAYARLFCDYMGIVFALFGVFVPVSLLLRDRRARMDELIYSRKASSLKIILARYIAVVTMSILPLLLISLIPLVQLAAFGIKNGFAIDYFAFFKYIGAWLLPTLLFTTSIGFLFTALTDTPIAILLQFTFGMLGMFSSITTLEGGNYGMALAIRHNSLWNLQLMKDGMDALIVNRLSYTLVSLLLLGVTIFIYSLKRRGRLDVRNRLQKIFKSGKGSGEVKSDI